VKRATEEQRIAAILALERLLSEVSGNPRAPAAKELGSALVSQAALAAFSAVDRGIIGCSLNTFKRMCVHIDGGFGAMDARRLRAAAALQAVATEPTESAKSTKERVQKRANTLNEKLAVATEDLMLLTRLLERAMSQGKQYATDSRDPSIVERCRREQADLRDMMSLRRVGQVPLRLVTGTEDRN